MSRRVRCPAVLTVAMLLVGGLLAACSSGAGEARSVRVLRPLSSPAKQHGGPAKTVEYLPGVGADVYLPRAAGASLVVLVPGGGWVQADRSGLAPLAEELAAYGYGVVSASYRPAQDGSRFPAPARDVACAVDFAVQSMRAAGRPPGRVLIAGHSAGAHLAALVALVGERFQAGCPYPAALPDSLVGLAGPYDITRLADVAEPLIGAPPQGDPRAWEAANPTLWAAERPGLSALLITGDQDWLVPEDFARQFAAALERGGHRLRLEVVPGADHNAVLQPSITAPLIVEWLGTLGATPAP